MEKFVARWAERVMFYVLAMAVHAQTEWGNPLDGMPKIVDFLPF